MLLDDAILLGLTQETYSEAGIKKAFRQMVMQVHPDVGGTAKQFMEAERAQRNLREALREDITAEQIFGGEPYKFEGIKETPHMDNLDGITSLDLCLLISHISMLYYGDTLELSARDGRLFRYGPNDFISGEIVPFLRDYIAWSCETKSGLIEILQPFEFSNSPRIVVAVTVEELSLGEHQFMMMFGGKPFTYTFEKTELIKSYISADMKFPLGRSYINGYGKEVILTIELDLFF